ncbi:LicD family protein [Alphaproteobacteria bacterium]|nr:LicD family protein [Alphaproteobacteria bacterium]
MRIFLIFKYTIAYFLSFKNRRKKILNIKKRGKKVLGDISVTFANENIVYWIDGGTLLGIVRDKSLLVGDVDLDFGIFSDQALRVCQLLEEEGFIIRSLFHDTHQELKLIKAQKYGVDIDFAVFAKTPKGCLRCSPRSFSGGLGKAMRENDEFAMLVFKFDRSFIEPVVLHQWNDIDLFVPCEHSSYLDVYYRNWRVPQKALSYFTEVYSTRTEKYQHHNDLAYIDPCNNLVRTSL